MNEFSVANDLSLTWQKLMGRLGVAEVSRTTDV